VPPHSLCAELEILSAPERVLAQEPALIEWCPAPTTAFHLRVKSLHMAHLEALAANYQVFQLSPVLPLEGLGTLLGLKQAWTVDLLVHEEVAKCCSAPKAAVAWMFAGRLETIWLCATNPDGERLVSHHVQALSSLCQLQQISVLYLLHSARQLPLEALQEGLGSAFVLVSPHELGRHLQTVDVEPNYLMTLPVRWLEALLTGGLLLLRA